MDYSTEDLIWQNPKDAREIPFTADLRQLATNLGTTVLFIAMFPKICFTNPF